MNIQTEHLENQLVRFTITIENTRLEEAKQKAARKVAGQVRIPGFRRGKVPYHILIKNGLEGAILEEAVDNLSQELYKAALLANPQLEPYGPGSFEDFKLEEAPTFIYTVPLQADAQLGDYRAIRHDYTAPEVTEEMLETAIQRLREQEASAEESELPIAMGNRVTLDLHSVFADEPPVVADEEASSEETEQDADDDDDDDDASPPKGAQFVHEHGAVITLDSDNDAILPGFSEKLVGANVGDELDFELTVPHDDPEYEDIAGRKVQFNVSIEKIETITLPELDDEFAQRLTEDDPEGVLTFEQLRERMRDNLQKQLERQAKQAYVDAVLDDLVAQTTVMYPDVMLSDQLDDIVESFKNRLQGQGINWDMYAQVTGETEERLREQYQTAAIKRVKRDAILREILKREQITATQEEVNARIEEMLLPFGDNQEIRKFFDNPSSRMSMLNEVLEERLRERIFAIATGQELPDLSLIANSDEVSTPDAVSSETADEVVSDIEDTEPTA